MVPHPTELFNNNSFYRVFVKVNLWFCTFQHDSRPHKDDTSDKTPFWNAGTEYLSDAIQFLFSSTKSNLSLSNDLPTDDGIHCDMKIDSTSEHKIAVHLLFMIILSLYCICITSLVLCICFKTRRKLKVPRTGVVYSSTSEAERSCQQDTPTRQTRIANDLVRKRSVTDESRIGKLKAIPLVFPNNYARNGENNSSEDSEVGWFLKNSVDYVFSELDKYLLDRASSSSTSTVNTSGSNSMNEHITSPRLTTRRTVPRSRHGRGSSPMLSRTDEPTERKAWQEFQQKIVPLGKFPYHNDMYRNTEKIVDLKVKNLIQFYNAQCIVRFEQWNGACLVANYALCLLEKSIKNLNKISNGFTFSGFEVTGSITKGLKSSQANQFDVLMVFNSSGFKISSALDQTSSGSIPPGKIVLKTETFTHNLKELTGKQHDCLKSFKFENETCLCISSEELCKMSETMIEQGLQKLYTETRSLIDRLPFRIQRSTTASLTLSLDTRNIIGLNLPEIKIQVIPAIPLHIGGWYQLSTVFAVPPWHAQDVKRKSSSRAEGQHQSCSHDILWSLSLGELEKTYVTGINRKMEMGGVSSCHIICLMILKTLFTSVTRRSLLDRGEITPYILETVINFLLLESTPSDWTIDKLAERFSDSVHFLRAALEHGRLPNFFLNNPHLIKQMPALTLYPFLTKGRQENLLSETRQEAIEKTIKFMNHRLKEMKMEACVKEEYSEDMWEYEFFVFN